MSAPFLIQWSWKALPTGAVVLQDIDGNTVMDCARRGLQACVPRFHSEQTGGMRFAHSLMDASGQIAHPVARQIEMAPTVCDALAFAIRFYDQLTPADAERMRAVLARVNGSQA